MGAAHGRPAGLVTLSLLCCAGCIASSDAARRSASVERTPIAATATTSTTTPTTTVSIATTSTVPLVWDVERGPIGLVWEWPPDRPIQPPEPVVATTRSARPTFEVNGIRVEIDAIVLLDSRLAGEPGEQCREIIDRGLRNQGEQTAQRDTTCLVVSYWMSAPPTVPASIETPIRLQRFRSFDSILVMPPGTATYDPTWGAGIQTPGGSAVHFQEYIDVRPGARIGFDIGSDAIGFTSFEYEIPSLEAFEEIDLPW